MEKLLFVVAHPDDAELMFGGTIYEYAKNGHEIHFIVVTDGSNWCRGEYKGKRNLVKLRKEECLKSANYLGVKTVLFLDYPDGKITEEDIYENLVKRIKNINPTIIFTHGPKENHHDHIIVNKIMLRICNTKDEPAPITNYLFDCSKPVTNFKGLVVHWNLNDGLDSEVSFIRLDDDHYQKKIKALSFYKTQFNEEDYKKIKKQQEIIMRYAGNIAYCDFAETYKVVNKQNIINDAIVIGE